MKIKKRIFNGFIIAVLTAVVSVPAFADGECMQEDKDMIAAPFAMCSTHAYNIAFAENPDPANREFMREVIGLKTTFFTQQLYKQYDQLDSMVRRLKTQLKKAVLTNNLKAAGAKSDDDDDDKDSGKYYSKEDYVQISGAKDCSSSWSSKEIFDCLAGNYNHIKSGDKSTAYKKQLKRDYDLACDTLLEQKGEGEPCNENNSCLKKDIRSNSDFTTCLSNLRTVIQKGKEAAADTEAKRNNPLQHLMDK